MTTKVILKYLDIGIPLTFNSTSPNLKKLYLEKFVSMYIYLYGEHVDYLENIYNLNKNRHYQISRVVKNILLSGNYRSYFEPSSHPLPIWKKNICPGFGFNIHGHIYWYNDSPNAQR